MTEHATTLRDVAPGLRLLTTYRRSWLPKDLVAGVVLTALLVPQGMAYAELAGLPPITGLYTTIMCLLAYAVFGPSRILVLGPDSSLGPMIAATILPLVAAGGDPERAVALASILALMVGAIMVLASVARLGFIADLLSKPTMIGYMNGLALTILVGQLPKLLGFGVDADGLFAELTGFVRGVAAGEVVPAAAAVGLGGVAVILVLQRWLPKVPAVLVMVVLAMAASSIFGLGERGVSLVGELPQGFPPLTIPTVQWSDLAPLAAGALAIAVVSLADTISTASAFAARSGQEINGNQEMLGIGAANLAAGLFQGFPVSTSASRTAVAERAGARTQLTGVIGAALIVLMIVLLPGLFRTLPQAALAAVVITASLSLADLAGTRRLWHQRKVEFTLSMVAFAGVALLGVLPGILIAVGLSILNVFRHAWRPYSTILGRVDGLAGYHDVRSYPDGRAAPGPGDLPVRCAAAVRQRQDVPGRGPPAGPRRAGSAVDRRRRRADHRRGHDRVRRPLRTRPPARRAGPEPGVRRTEGPRPAQDRAVRARPARSKPRHFFPTVETAVEAFRAETGADWTTPPRRSPSGTEPPPAPQPTSEGGTTAASSVGPVPRVSSEDRVPKSPA